jgi:histidinol-phosphate aminotransferase
LVRFADAIPPNVLLVLDEAYIEFLEDAADFVSAIGHGERPNMLLMRTFSKIYGLAGLRIGYGIGSGELVAALEKVRQPFNTNAIAQAGALAALEDTGHVRDTLLNNRNGLRFFREAFGRLQIEFVPSSANFLLVRVGDGPRVFQALQRAGVIVRPMGGYELPEWIRISVGTPDENARCLDALQRALGR